jgi:hypothetical protein
MYSILINITEFVAVTCNEQSDSLLLCSVGVSKTQKCCSWTEHYEFHPVKKSSPLYSHRLCTGRTAYRGSRGIALPFHDRGTRRGEWSTSRLGRSLPPGKIQCPLYRTLGGPQGRSGQVRKISPPPGFDPRTVQPVASRYTDYATRPTSYCKFRVIFVFTCQVSLHGEEY